MYYPNRGFLYSSGAALSAQQQPPKITHKESFFALTRHGLVLGAFVVTSQF
jgi:hypothetical protein